MEIASAGREFTFNSGSHERLDYNRIFLVDSPRKRLDGFGPKTARAIIGMRRIMHGCLRMRGEYGGAVAAS